jgi:hypothetical protein
MASLSRLQASLARAQGPPVASTRSAPSGGASGTFSFLSVGSSLGSLRVGGEAPRVRLIRTNSTGNSEWCCHALGPEDTDTETKTKICTKLKRQGSETCGTRHQGIVVALEPDAIYIKPAKDRIFLGPYVPCLLLEESYVEELTREVYDLVEVRTLLRDLVTASQDLPPKIDREAIDHWRREINGPLHTPLRTRPLSGHQVIVEDESDEDDLSSPSSPGFSPERDLATPSVNVEYAVEDSDEVRWDQELPTGLWDFIVSLKVGLEKASNALLLTHEESIAKWNTTGRDFHALEVRMSLISNTLGEYRPLSGITVSNVWDGLAQLSTLAANASHDAALRKSELKELQDDLETLVLLNEARAKEIAALSEDLRLTQECASSALDIVSTMHEAGSAGSIAPNGRHENSNFNADAHLGHELVQAQFGHDIQALKSDLASLKSNKTKSGSGSLSGSLLKGISTRDDVYAWVIQNFGGGKDPDPSNSMSDTTTDQGTNPAIYGGFVDLFVLFATFEEYQSKATKGETLKEMDNLQKAGFKHPSEAVINYSFKRTVPATFGQGLVAGGSFLPALKTIEDWDSGFSSEPMPKPGLKQLLLERCEGVESHLRSIIEELYERRGFKDVASLAKEMLSASVKLLKILIDYTSELYRTLTARSGFLPEQAWGLSSQCVRGVFMELGKPRASVGIVDPKDSAYRNTARVLFVLLKTHDEMSKFVVAEIMNHPVISTEYVKFLTANSPCAAVRRLETRVTAVESVAKAAHSEAKKALDKAVKK